MNTNHYNELVSLSREIFDAAAEKLTNYCASRYCGIGNDTMEQQMEDYLFITEEASAWFLGNALALLDADSQEAEIKTFTDNLRRVIRYAQQKGGSDISQADCI